MPRSGAKTKICHGGPPRKPCRSVEGGFLLPADVSTAQVEKIYNIFTTTTPQIAPNGRKLWQMLEKQHSEKVPETNRFRSIPGTFLVETTGLEPVTSCV